MNLYNIVGHGTQYVRMFDLAMNGGLSNTIHTHTWLSRALASYISYKFKNIFQCMADSITRIPAIQILSQLELNSGP